MTLHLYFKLYTYNIFRNRRRRIKYMQALNNMVRH